MKMMIAVQKINQKSEQKRKSLIVMQLQKGISKLEDKMNAKWKNRNDLKTIIY